MDSLFPTGQVADFGCSGKKKGVQVKTDIHGRRFYYTDTYEIIGNKTEARKSIVYCKYKDLDDFKNSLAKRHLSLKKAIAVYLAEGAFPTTTFEIKGGRKGCETDTMETFVAKSASLTWLDIKSAKFKLVFNLPEDVGRVALKNQELIVESVHGLWFAVKPGSEIVNFYEGCEIANAVSDDHRICVNNLVMTFQPETGLFKVTPADFEESRLMLSDLPVWLKGAIVGRAVPMSILDITKKHKDIGRSLAIPCSVKWRNSHKLDPNAKATCIYFSAATEGSIYVIFAAIPKDKKTWYYLYISQDGVAFYKGIHLAKTQTGVGLGTLGDANLYESYFVCLMRHESTRQISIQYGKADPDSVIGKVHSTYTFPSKDEMLPLSYYSFGAGSSTITFHDVQVTKKLPIIECKEEGFEYKDGMCKSTCHEECVKCKKPKDNSECTGCKNYQLWDPSIGKKLCLQACPAGHYGMATGSMKMCFRCGAGKYQPKEGQTKCLICPVGKVASSDKAASCTVCPGGHAAAPAPGLTKCFPIKSICYNTKDTNSYTGKLSMTKDGSPCQNWTAQKPIRNRYKVGDHNHCRNPSRSSVGPWCYRADYKGTGLAWGKCDVPFC